MARRSYSRLQDYRLTSDLSQQPGRISSSSSSLSSSVFTSRTSTPASSTSYRPGVESSLAVGRSLLGAPRSVASTTSDVRDYSAITESGLSPKANIRKYGRTTHSQAFASNSVEPVSSQSARQQREFSAISSLVRPLDSRSRLEKNGDKQAASKVQKPEVSSTEEGGRKEGRLEYESSKVHRHSNVSDGVDETSDSERGLRRLRRHQRLEGKGTLQTTAVSETATTDGSQKDSGATDGDTTNKVPTPHGEADGRGSRELRSVFNRIRDDRNSRNSSQISTQVKIVVVAPDDAGQKLDAHLDELPVRDRVSGHGGQPARREWTEEDLDQFVKQLSNPQHQVSKRCPREDITGSDRTRGVLTRSATDTSSQAHDLDTSFLEGDKATRLDDEDSKSTGLVGGLSGLRLIRNKKMTRSSHIDAKRSALLKSRDNHRTVSALLMPDDVDDGEDATSSSGGDGSHVGAAFPCGSSPEGSDGEGSGIAASRDPVTGDVSKDVKKGRFRKMLTRPLNRSQSAGCAKDVPAHAIFLQKQQTTSKEAEWVEALKPRGSEGDIREIQTQHDDDVEDEDTCHLDNLSGIIHKIKSADSTMMAVDDISVVSPLGAVSQAKHKSRNIAKKISRKLFLRRRHTDSNLGFMGADDGARRLATVEPEEARQWSKSFENLLFDKTGLELFRGFLMTEHSDENIEFWIACENYKNSKSSKQLAALAVKIFNDYVAIQSKREINLDSKTRSYTYESVTCNPTRQTFDEAQRKVQALMEKDSYRRFLESEIYHDLASGNIQHKS